nr:immunoglobulin light chain junction region [Macaca mulatta]
DYYCSSYEASDGLF